MNDIEQLKAEIERRLRTNQSRALNKNAVDASITAVTGLLSGNPLSAIDALEKIFLGRGEALEAEK
jgi:hypothetical protein